MAMSLIATSMPIIVTAPLVLVRYQRRSLVTAVGSDDVATRDVNTNGGKGDIGTGVVPVPGNPQPLLVIAISLPTASPLSYTASSL